MIFCVIYDRFWAQTFHWNMTSSNGDIFHITGDLWGESTGERWIPLTKVTNAKLWFFYLPLQTVEQTIETPVIWDAIHYGFIVMKQTIANLTGQFDHFVVTGGTVCCCNDNWRCHQWRQSCQIDDLLSLLFHKVRYIYMDKLLQLTVICGSILLITGLSFVRFNTLVSEQNDWHFVGGIFDCIFLNACFNFELNFMEISCYMSN